VDASVVAKWYIMEEDFEKALRIRDLHSAGEITLSSPMLVVYELGNTLSKHPSFTVDDSEKAFQSFLDLSLKLRSFAEHKLLRRSFEISRELRITFYDALYVTLAKESQATLITADKQLHNKVKRYCDTKLLGEVALEELASGRSVREA